MKSNLYNTCPIPEYQLRILSLQLRDSHNQLLDLFFFIQFLLQFANKLIDVVIHNL